MVTCVVGYGPNGVPTDSAKTEFRTVLHDIEIPAKDQIFIILNAHARTGKRSERAKEGW